MQIPRIIGCLLILFLWKWTGLAVDLFGLEGNYFGLSPGSGKVALTESQINIRNNAVSASWNLKPRGIQLSLVTDRISGHTISFSNELFQIVLENGRRYPASNLKREGPPKITELARVPNAAQLCARIIGMQVELSLVTDDSNLRVNWRAFIRENANYIRQEIELIPQVTRCLLKEIIWFDETIPGAQIAGKIDGSPILVRNFFLGAEDPHVQIPGIQPSKNYSKTTQSNSVSIPAVSFHIPRNTPLSPGEKLTSSFVVGVAPPGQIRRAFLYYLERERAHPFRPFLHYNSWYDIAWDPFALNETNCLEAIQIIGEKFIQAHDVIMDAMVFDDGWDDPKSLWNFHSGFPHEFKPLDERCRHFRTRLGVWLSPFGGYGEPKKQRLQFGQQQGYETNANGFSLAGPKYYSAFKNSCVHMIRDYGVNHFKFDGIASGMYANGSGAAYTLDTEAMQRLMLELRSEDPNLYINLTTGSWPSPFWLRYADSIWRQGGDMGFAGKGNKQQQWLTYRDQEIFRNIVGKGPLFPLNSLMTQGVAYSRRGDAGCPDFNSAGFKDDVQAFFGSGTGLQELYIQPGKLTAEDWKILAEAAKWSRANADILVDTHWIGGDPSKSEIYGFASWSPRKGIIMLRNPDDQSHVFDLNLQKGFELPDNAVSVYSLKSPWLEDASKPAISTEADKVLSIPLQPFEVLNLEARPIKSDVKPR